jgi:threonyl-tRNA synthetase
MGSIERFSAVLIEHLGGNFPLWLAPEQIRVIPVADAHNADAKKVYEELTGVGIRATLDDSKESMGKKIRNAKKERLPYFIVVGDKEVAEKTVTVESRNGTSENMELESLGNHLLAEIETKKIS